LCVGKGFLESLDHRYFEQRRINKRAQVKKRKNTPKGQGREGKLGGGGYLDQRNLEVSLSQNNKSKKMIHGCPKVLVGGQIEAESNETKGREIAKKWG